MRRVGLIISYNKRIMRILGMVTRSWLPDGIQG